MQTLTHIPSPLRWLLVAAGLLFGSAAHAQSCTYSATGLNFGVVNGNPVPQVDVAGNLKITCSGTVGKTIRACVGIPIGAGSGSYASRRMLFGVNFITFNLYKDAARSQIWGLVNVSPYPLAVDIPVLTATNNIANVPIYGRVDAQVGPNPTGTYTSAFSAGANRGESRIQYSPGTSCNTFVGARVRFGFSSTVGIAPSCTMTANDLDFGTLGTLSVAVNASSSLSVNCSNGSPYTIALNGGTVSGSIASRKLSTTGSGPGVISYQLYKDAARSLLWGDGVTGGTTLASTGTGLTVAVPTYGRVPSQATPIPGAYLDTVTATLTY